MLRSKLKRLAVKIVGLRSLRTFKYGFRIIPGEFTNVLEIIKTILKICYNDNSDSDQYLMGRIRQNCHILDKGLQVKEYETGRSKRYYEQAVQDIKQISDNKVKGDPSLKWAKSCISKFKQKQTKKDLNFSNTPEITRCSYEDIIDIIRTRRSIRQYLPTPIDEITIRKIIGVIDWSPTSCNRQPARVFVTNDIEVVRECMKCSVGATCFSDYVPVYICFCADLRAYDMPTEFFNPFIDVSLGIQNCNLVACSLNVSITMLSWANHTQKGETRLRRLLGIPDYCQIIVNAVAGYPECAGDVPMRKDLSVTLNLNGSSHK